MRRSAITTGLAVVLLASTLADCAPSLTDPEMLLTRAGEEMARLQSVRFVLLRDGDPVLLDAALGARFTRASGEYRAPGQVHAVVNATVGSAVLTIEVLWSPQGVFATNPLTGVYAKVSGPIALDAPGVFAPGGLPDTLRNGLRAVTLVGSETLDGRDTYHVRAEADGARLKPLTGGVLVEGTHTVELWIDRSSSHLLRLRDRDPTGSGWRLDLTAQNTPVDMPLP
ncbi:MAG TPA: LppX_LprAFG lipoprotein [Candidatus Limnocylindria bacterium]|nr:LppX_LprAFG lipoprotein [Candidatus Limnocylindria bacterium]HEV8671415.1 LppX_LprAFG lipoprotein [Candidatus Limnocylindria bacterium]